eukprot:g65753.t1
MGDCFFATQQCHRFGATTKNLSSSIVLGKSKIGLIFLYLKEIITSEDLCSWKAACFATVFSSFIKPRAVRRQVCPADTVWIKPRFQLGRVCPALAMYHCSTQLDLLWLSTKKSPFSYDVFQMKLLDKKVEKKDAWSSLRTYLKYAAMYTVSFPLESLYVKWMALYHSLSSLPTTPLWRGFLPGLASQMCTVYVCRRLTPEVIDTMDPEASSTTYHRSLEVLMSIAPNDGNEEEEEKKEKGGKTEERDQQLDRATNHTEQIQQRLTETEQDAPDTVPSRGHRLEVKFDSKSSVETQASIDQKSDPHEKTIGRALVWKRPLSVSDVLCLLAIYPLQTVSCRLRVQGIPLQPSVVTLQVPGSPAPPPPAAVVYPSYTGVSHCVKTMLRQEGVSSFYRGFVLNGCAGLTWYLAYSSVVIVNILLGTPDF